MKPEAAARFKEEVVGMEIEATSIRLGQTLFG
jgi:hypothetical protein